MKWETLITNAALNQTELNGWIRLTCLHPLLPPNSDHAMIHLEGYSCSVCTCSHTISCVWQISQQSGLPNNSQVVGIEWYM